MGIDVTGFFQRREADRWVYVKNIYDSQRGYVRAWLGWGWSDRSGWVTSSGIMARPPAVAPIVALRGLPDDFDPCEKVYDGEFRRTVTTGYLVGSQSQSWLMTDEILKALPALSALTFMVPARLYWQSLSLESDPERWSELTGLGQDRSLPKLVAVSSRPEGISYDDQEVPVGCLYDFTEEVAYFIDEVRRLHALHAPVRFVYGFA